MSFLDLSNVELQAPKNFDALPSGVYLMQVDEAKVKDTKSGGKMIEIRLKVTAGEHKGRSVFDSFNHENASADAQRIGLQQLKTLMTCAGMGNVLESVKDLEGRKVAAKLGQEKKHNSEEMRNKVVAYMSLSAPAAVEAAEEAAAGGAKSAPPGWA